jgi:hypothetical protein
MPVLPGTPPIPIHLKRSARARRFSLRVSRLDGKVTLTLPAGARDRDALGFLEAQEGWIRQTLAGMPEVAGLRVGPGCRLPVEGALLEIVPAPGRGIRAEGDRLLVPGAAETAGARAGAWLRVLARDRLARACARHGAALGRDIGSIVLRDTRSRWGSCSVDGRLMFSWRLVMAPPSVLDYVAAHEVAHLVEMNHSAAFWAVVGRLFPGWQAQRAWLHRHGQDLHRYRFGD